jgi:hypothetical protein
MIYGHFGLAYRKLKSLKGKSPSEQGVGVVFDRSNHINVLDYYLIMVVVIIYFKCV